MSSVSSEGYFVRLLREQSTACWINSAIQREIEAARGWGAIGNTMNPTHPPKALKADFHLWGPVMEEILESNRGVTDDVAAELLTQRMAKRSSLVFLSMYEDTERQYGYVTIQSDPNTNHDPVALVRQAISYKHIGPNVVPKVPSTDPGRHALEELVAQGTNVIATAGFSVSQAIAMAEAYAAGLKRFSGSGPNPRCYVVIIPGVFDDYLHEVIKRDGINIDPNLVRYAGIAWCRRVYRIFQERGYQAEIQVGGTRENYHITDLVGGNVHITHSFSTWDRLQKESLPAISRIGEQAPEQVILELQEKLVDFRRAYAIDGLMPD
ncbi:MAG TPA: transaldolase family protein, partial [Anaerolineae bacterium]|nr:transaldolase family protein [Anaerolineae bacterium]